LRPVTAVGEAPPRRPPPDGDGAFRFDDDVPQDPFDPDPVIGPHGLGPLGPLGNGAPTPAGVRPPAGRISIARLAPWLVLPTLARDFMPASPWAGTCRHRASPRPPSGASDRAELGDRVDAAVRRSIGEAEVVAVAHSGGLDSSVLLYTVARIGRHEGRRVIAVTVDVLDDRGRSTGAVAAQVADALGIDCELVRIDPVPGRWPEPDWHPSGPRLDAWPRLHSALAIEAGQRGATVLLHGEGADRLMQAPAHLASRLIRRGRLRAGRTARADIDGSAPVASHAATILGGPIGSWSRARLYASFSGWVTGGTASPVVHERFRDLAHDWIAGFQTEMLRVALHHRASWSEAAALHQVFPFDTIKPALALRERSPFLDPELAAYAYDIPLEQRFDPELPTAYLRRKALLAGLLPSAARAALPPHRQRTYQAYHRYWRWVADDATEALGHGLVRGDWRRACRDAFDLAAVLGCDRWLRHAVRQGFEVDTDEDAWPVGER
jgi:asparagine synthase (glutamine-hydrolysing)